MAIRFHRVRDSDGYLSNYRGCSKAGTGRDMLGKILMEVRATLRTRS
jgi:predicted NAD-dependent protein-ADP-ribosyltransferase YbiA (DUF1768 family)